MDIDLWPSQQYGNACKPPEQYEGRNGFISNGKFRVSMTAMDPKHSKVEYLEHDACPASAVPTYLSTLSETAHSAQPDRVERIDGLVTIWETTESAAHHLFDFKRGTLSLLCFLRHRQSAVHCLAGKVWGRVEKLGPPFFLATPTPRVQGHTVPTTYDVLQSGYTMRGLSPALALNRDPGVHHCDERWRDRTAGEAHG